MARMAGRPKRVMVWYRGLPYWLDLVVCRRALVNRQVAGQLDSMERLANAVAISRSTASRFFSGRPTSLAVTLKLMEALHLTFDEVFTPVSDDELAALDLLAADEAESEGATSIGARPEPKPQRPESSVGLRMAGAAAR